LLHCAFCSFNILGTGQHALRTERFQYDAQRHYVALCLLLTVNLWRMSSLGSSHIGQWAAPVTVV